MLTPEQLDKQREDTQEGIRAALRVIMEHTPPGSDPQSVIIRNFLTPIIEKICLLVVMPDHVTTKN